MKKQNLIKSLKSAIRALQNGTIHYDWVHQESCNCGVVSQAVLGKSLQEVKDAIHPMHIILNTHNHERKVKREEAIDTTWKNFVQFTCSITGKTDIQILKDLQEAGLTTEDMCHLEYLENPAILKRSGIMFTGTITKNVKVGTRKITRKKGWFSKEVIEEDIMQEQKQQVTDYLRPRYYQKKENLIKYLTAWVEILEEESKDTTQMKDPSYNELNEELLKAVADEKYELAASLRDRILVTGS